MRGKIGDKSRIEVRKGYENTRLFKTRTILQEIKLNEKLFLSRYVYITVSWTTLIKKGGLEKDKGRQVGRLHNRWQFSFSSFFDFHLQN